MNRFLWWGPLVALFAIAGYVSAGESTDVKELLERMKKMEAKMADQEKTIKDLRAGNETKATASQQVDKALSNSSAGAIFHDPNLHKRPIKMGGYLDVTYQYAFNQPDVPRPVYNMERGFDAMDNNDFNVHLAKIFFDGTAKEKGQAGFRIDLAFGSDAQRIASFGEGPNWLDDDTEYTYADHRNNFSIEQAYIDYIIPVANGIRMKVGKFVTPFGYEVIEAQDNWNATRSFNFVHALPTTHTGIGFEYQVFSNWAVAGYFVNGNDNIIDNNEGKTGIVQSKWSPTKWLTWTVTGSVGNDLDSNVEVFGDQTDRADEDTTYLVNTVLTFKPWEKWEFAAEATYGLTENQNIDTAHFGGNDGVGGDAQWWGAAGYLKYSFLPGWYLAARGEYLRDDGATRTTYGTRFSEFGGDGCNVELYSGTVTMSYSPVSPFEIRLEYRYDAASNDAFISKEYHPGDSNILDDGQTSHRVNTQDTLTVQFLYKF